MEDLLENFSKHMNKIISSKLGSKIRNLARAKTSYKTEEDYARLEMNIQMLIESYLSNLKDNDYKEVANNIFNSFVEEDDNNLIKAINFYKRTYEYYQEMNFRKKFYKWRKTALKLKMINNLILKDNLSKTKNINNINIVKENNKKLPKLIYENNKIEENNNYINNEVENQENNFSNSNFNNNRGTYEINSFDNIIDENIEDFIEKRNKNNYNNEKYKFNYENNDNINEEKEEFNEDLDYDNLYSKNNF